MPRKAPQQPRRRFPALVVVFLAVGAAVVLFGMPERPGPAEVAENAAAAKGKWAPKAKSKRWTCIVIHHSAGESGGADRFDEWHREKGWDGLGYHFVIGNGTDTASGQVEVGPRWVAQKHGAHCKTDDDYFNQHGIGICLVGIFEKHRPGKHQLESLRQLVAFLCRTYDIPPERVYTHGGVTGQTHCPGKHFDVKTLRKSIARRK